MSFERARRIADAILYEGYVLYPYRASSRKNRYRWTFGVVAPRAWSAAGGCERSSVQLECLVTAAAGATPTFAGCVRFLQVERRDVERARPGGGFEPVASLTAGGEEHITWEEGIERELPFTLTAPCEPTRLLHVRLDGTSDERAIRDGNDVPEVGGAIVGGAIVSGAIVGRAVVGRVRRVVRPLVLTLTAATTRLSSELFRLSIVVENVTPTAALDAPREEAVASSLVGAHLLLSIEGGAFLSLLDPPPEARRASEACVNSGLYPVLAGEPGTRELLLASPIVLYDHPQIAAESPGDTFDGTEIDELLALSTRSLTDEEKREARATDRRAAEVIDRAERLSDAAIIALHGTRREAPLIFGPGCRVRVRLGVATGTRRTDAQDMFLDGRIGTIEEVREDFDGQTHLAVILEDDPAAELHRWYGRHLHFRPEELELVEAAS